MPNTEDYKEEEAQPTCGCVQDKYHADQSCVAEHHLPTIPGCEFVVAAFYDQNFGPEVDVRRLDRRSGRCLVTSPHRLPILTAMALADLIAHIYHPVCAAEARYLSKDPKFDKDAEPACYGSAVV